MVHALLAGCKTQTRRMVKLMHGADVVVTNGKVWKPARVDYVGYVQCPYGQPGDLLWVREAWRAIDAVDDLPPRALNAAHRVWYEADAAKEGQHQPGFGKLRPGMFMPRWASRISLEITGTRVEHLQDIGDADSLAEGVYPTSTGLYPGSPRAAYQKLWEKINGPDSWSANPWVWVVEFKQIKGISK